MLVKFEIGQVLRQQRNRAPPLQNDVPRRGLEIAGQDPQQGGLARAIGAHQGDLVAPRDAQVEIGEQRSVKAVELDRKMNSLKQNEKPPGPQPAPLPPRFGGERQRRT